MTTMLTYAEVRDGAVTNGSFEVLGAARRLADAAGGTVAAMIIGSGVSDLAQSLIERGADTVYVVDDPAVAPYQNQTHLQAIDAVVAQAQPSAILFAKSFVTLDFAPRLAFRHNLGLANDVIALRHEGGALVATRPVFGGSALAEVQPEGTPQLFTVRAKTQEPLAADPSRVGTVVAVSATIAPSAIKVVDRKKEESTGPKLTDATRIVAGGRGIGEAKENWDQLGALAATIGGALGASRAAVDAGWVPTHLQIGLTGTTVSPDLYIAVGISGAVQHMAGCANSKTIVAINKDRDAAIFRQARFGVEGDWKKVIPALNAELQKML